MPRKTAGLCVLVAILTLLLQRPVSAATAERTVVRFSAPEIGGKRSPRFIFSRELAFEARLEALADPDYTPEPATPYHERHVTAAIERHVAETLLAGLRIDPPPTREEQQRQLLAARLILTQRVGGAVALQKAARAEGIAEREVRRLLRRQAQASLYLDRMVAPMLRPSDTELLAAYRSGHTPFSASAASGGPTESGFEAVRQALRRWYTGKQLALALATFYQNARSRVSLTVLPPLSTRGQLSVAAAPAEPPAR